MSKSLFSNYCPVEIPTRQKLVAQMILQRWNDQGIYPGKLFRQLFWGKIEKGGDATTLFFASLRNETVDPKTIEDFVLDHNVETTLNQLSYLLERKKEFLLEGSSRNRFFIRDQNKLLQSIEVCRTKKGLIAIEANERPFFVENFLTNNDRIFLPAIPN